MLGMELWASCMLGKCYTIELDLQLPEISCRSGRLHDGLCEEAVSKLTSKTWIWQSSAKQEGSFPGQRNSQSKGKPSTAKDMEEDIGQTPGVGKNSLWCQGSEEPRLHRDSFWGELSWKVYISLHAQWEAIERFQK
jgi:hypothetical protein